MAAADMQSASSSVSGDGHIFDDCVEDGCSICLEPFNSLDPPMVTKCKHEYHFQCILEWSQRSAGCPICSQHLVLKDPASQELLEGVQSDRNLRRNLGRVDQDIDVNDDFPREDDPGFEQQIMRHFTAVASRARNISSRRRHATPDIGRSVRSLPSAHSRNMSNMARVNSSFEVQQNQASCFSNFDQVVSIGAPAVTRRACSLNIPSFGDSSSLTSENIQYSGKFSEPPPNNPRIRSSSSEFLAFSESLKSKISNASTRYKESISNSTRVFKEKLVARKGFVKELSGEVQRETSAGIARMIGRLDFRTKRASFPTGNSKSPHEAKENNKMVQSTNQKIKGTEHDKILDSSSISIKAISEGVEVLGADEPN